jgi:heme oxygenase
MSKRLMNSSGNYTGYDWRDFSEVLPKSLQSHQPYAENAQNASSGDTRTKQQTVYTTKKGGK